MQEGAQSVASIGTSLNAEKDILATALSCIVWENIFVGEGLNNKVDNKFLRPIFMQLKGIYVDGVVHPSQKISGGILQKLVIKFNVPKARKNAKKAYADGLVLFPALWERHQRDRAIKPVTAANIPIKPITFCFSNVITGLVILPVFQELKGKLLNKNQLQEKLAQDQLIWESLLKSTTTCVFSCTAAIPMSLSLESLIHLNSSRLRLSTERFLLRFSRIYLQTWRAHYRGGSCLGITVT